MSQLKQLREAVALSPNNVPLLLLLGQACLDDLSLDEGRSVYEKVLQLKPDEIEARLGIVKILHLSGKTSEAVVRVEALTQERPDFAPLWLTLSRLLLSDGDIAQAKSAYERARELDRSLRDEPLERELYRETSGRPPAETKEEAGKVPLRSTAWNASAGEKDEPSLDVGEIERPSVTFKDVGGMDAIKEEIRMKILYPLRNPDLFRAYGKKIGGGVLIYGPPGCGKTLISRATAGEIQSHFISIGIHQVLDMWLGNSERNLHELFELARSHAPAVLFFDEIDALAANRMDLKHSAARTLINQFLAELDGTVSGNDGVLVLGATNAPWHIDPAFRRPGRFDRVLFVPPPDEAARAAIIDILARGKPVAELDAKELSKKTKEFSGADLKAVFDVTIERVLAKAMEDGRVVPISTKELAITAKAIRPSTKSWFESAKNYALYSNQSGFYDDVLSYLGLNR